MTVSYHRLEHLLRRARRLIESREHWVQRDIAQDITGESLSAPHSPTAAKFCAIGALCRAASPSDEDSVDQAIAVLAHIVRSLVGVDGGSNDEIVVEFNDSYPHGEVIELFELAIRCVSVRFSDHHQRTNRATSLCPNTSKRRFFSQVVPINNSS
jgi:hypothetical protein